jgi:N12 class adenine-specific DNA methylase
MALADQLGAVDPQGIVTGLVADQAPDLVQNDGSVDPQSVLDRLIRKGLSSDQQKALSDAKTNAAPDGIDQFGKTKEQVDAEPQPDFTQFGSATPQSAQPIPGGGTVAGGAWAGAKSLAQAPITATGKAIQAAARTVNDITPTMVQTAGGEGSPLSVEDLTPPPAEPVQKNPVLSKVYNAGQAVRNFGEQQIPVSEAEKKTYPIWTGVGSAVGTLAPLVALGALNPEAAIAGGAALFGGSGSQDTYEAAIAHGADQETASAAANLSGLANAALGSAPIGLVLRPFQKFMPAASGYAVRMLAQAAQNGVVFAGIGEAQEYIGEQIAKAYDPKAGYSLDANRLIVSLLSGGLLGAGHAAYDRYATGKAVSDLYKLNQPAAGGEADDTAPGALPRPDAGPGPGPGPGQGPGPDTGTGAGAGAGPGEAEPEFQPDFSPAKRSTLEKVAAAYSTNLKDGHSAKDISSWSDAQLMAYLNDADKRSNPAKADAPVATPGTPDNPINLQTPQDLAHAVSVADETSSHAQGEANNAPRVHAVWNDLPITLETAGANNVRRGVAEDGTPWEQSMGGPSGYFKGTIGADGDHVDVTVGPQPGSKQVYVIDEKAADTGDFRQHKVMIGFGNQIDALNAYTQRTQGKSAKMVGGVRLFTPEQLKDWLKTGDTKAPLSDTMTAAAKAKDESILPEDAVPTSQHTDAVDGALRAAGVNPDAVRPADKARAAEIHAEGAPADQAFPVAVVRGLVDSGHITPDQVREAIGDEAAEGVLGTGGRAQRGARAETHGAGPGGEAAAPANGVGPRGNEGGNAEAASGGESGEPAVGQKPAGSAAGGEQRRENNGGAGNGAAAGVANDHNVAGSEPGERAEQAHPEHKATETPAAALIGARVKSMPEHKVVAADGKSVRVVPVVTEASKLIASSDPGYDKDIQPRERDRAAAQAQVREIATRLDPERLGYSAEADRGAPIVGPDGMVESGNGRVAALRALYRTKSPNAEHYRAWLAVQGVDLSKYKEPVLVRQRVTELDAAGRRGFAIAANQAATLSMSAPERALADADHLSSNVLGLIRNGANLGAAENRPFVRAFIAALPASERSALANKAGALSQEGLTRVKNAVLAKAYGDADVISRITEATDDETRSVSNGLVMSAPIWAKFRGEVEDGRVRREFDLTPDLMEAVKRVTDIRSRGENLAGFLAQHDGFDQLKSEVETWMRMMYDPHGKRVASAADIAKAISFYAEEAGKVTTDPRLGLDIPEIEPDEIQRGAHAKAQDVPTGARVGNGPSGNAARQAPGRRGAGEGGEEPGRPEQRSADGGRLRDQPSLFDEPGPDGKRQSVLPGTEPISDARLAQRRALERLRPKAEQKPAYEGLFSPREKQVDLEEAIAKAKPEGIEAVAVRDPQSGRVWSAKAVLHPDLIERAAQDLGVPEDKAADRLELGFKSDRGRFLTRAEASALVGAGELHATELSWTQRELAEAGVESYPGAAKAKAPVTPAVRAPIAKAAAAPKIKKQGAPAAPSLFDWEERNNERPRTQGDGEKTLGGMAPGPGEGPQVTRAPERVLAGSGGQRADGDRAPDEAGLPGIRGQGSRPAEVHPAAAGAGSGRPGRGNAAGTGGERKPVPEVPTGPNVKPAERPTLPAINYRITDETELGKGSEGVKFRDNIAAIQALKNIEREDRRATPEEQRQLARYVGWGGLANAFPDLKGAFKPDWKDRGEQLQGLLNKDEHRAAQHSTLAAHYTSKTVIDAMWKAAQRLGFKGGLSLETSLGTGNFIGLVPDAIAGKTRFVGVELDGVTARIAKLLYPQETVLHSGFQRVPMPDGEFVLSIGNPPFGSESLRFQHKPALQGYSIHNQFFLAALDALQPGGLHIGVVSHFLMDAQDQSARQAMAVKANLLGAIRLPDTAFKENARTEVVTDIVLMQRRTPADESQMAELVRLANTPGHGKEAQDARAVARKKLTDEAPWIETDKVRDPLGGEPMTVNQYFAKRPKMIVGRLERSGTMRGKEEVNVKLAKDADFAGMLDAAVENLPKNKINLDNEAIDNTLERYKTLADSIQIALAGHEVGHVEFNDRGQLTQISERETPSGDYEPTRRVLNAQSPWSRKLLMDPNGQWYTLEPKLNAKGEKVKTGLRLVYERKTFPDNKVPENLRLGQQRYDRLADLARLRDLTRKQIVLETQDAPPADMENNRGQLAASYRAFTGKHGLLHEPSNMRLLNEMPDGPLLMSLESGYRPAVTTAKAARTGQPVQKPSAKPSAILSRRVVPKYEPPTKAETVGDAIGIVLSERGRMDLARIGDLLGIPEDKVPEKLSEGDKPLAFLNPETKDWEARHDYLTGPVRQKLIAAREAGLAKNVSELEAVQPERWGADKVTPYVGSNWIPPKVYEDFAKQLLGVDGAAVNYSKATNSFNMLTDEYGGDKQAEWGTPDMPADAILRGMMNSRIPKVMREVSDGNGGTRRYEDKEASSLVVLKANEIASAFADWVFRDADRRNQLVDIFNDKFNTRVQRQHDGAFLALPGKNPEYGLRRHTRNAIRRGIYERNMLVDHCVGSGKTFLAIARAMERRRMGLSRKPMVAVPNHLVEQWAAEAHRLYPGAKVLAAGKNQFNRQNRRKLFAKIATGDHDLVIVPHSSFGFIGISPETELRFLEDQLRVAHEAVQAAAEEAAASGIGGFRKPFTVKEAERLVTNIETRMDALRSARRDNMLSFEQMGVDDLTVDEAHEFKNLFYSSRMTGVRGMGDKTGSQKSFDLYNKVRVLNESPTGTVTFLTGTPISNSAVEMYTMMRYLAAKELRELGIEHFDAWRSQFVSAEPKWEPTESGGLKEVTRLGRNWSNMRALMDLYYSFTDSVTQEDINKWYAEDNDGADFPIPKVVGGGRQTTVVQPTPAQQSILHQVIDGFNDLPNEPDPDVRNAERLRLMDRARKVSLDARAVDPRNPSKEEGGKLEAISDQAARIYHKWTKDLGAQLIFLDRSVPKAKGDDKIIKQYDDLIARRDKAVADKDEGAFRAVIDDLDKFNANEIEALRSAQNGGWNAYDQIKKNLIARGVPADEVRFIQEANNDAEKQALFDAVNDGRIRVLIGSTQRMGAGTNVQERLVGLHHGDVTWKPSDIEQREGRIIRQLNKLLDKYGKDFAVEIHNYVTERTVDAKMWDLNSEKLRMINGIRKYDGAFNMEFEDEDAVGMAEIAALASGDPLLMERVKLGGEIEKLEMQERGFRRKMFGIEDAVAGAQRAITDYPAKIVEEKAASDDMYRRVDALKKAVDARSVTIDGKTYKSRMEATVAATDRIAEIRGADEGAKYSINVDGADLTNKETIHAAIASALGDQEPFEAKIGGETVRGRYAAAHAILEKVRPIISEITVENPEHTVKLGTMLGADLEATARRSAADDFYVTLALRQDGRTLAAAQTSGPVSRKEPAPATIASGIRNLEKDINNILLSRGALMQSRVDAAKKDLPGLTAQLGQTFPQAEKLVALRDRQRDLINELDRRTKEAEGKGGPLPTPPKLIGAGGRPVDAKLTGVDAEQDAFLKSKGMTWEEAAALSNNHLRQLDRQWSDEHPGEHVPLVRVERFDPADIEADPARFQYRDNVVNAETGVTDKPMQSGWQQTAPMVVWQDKAGGNFVVDGHHRLERAKALEAAGEKVPLDAITLREKDGITPQIAKDFGQRRNEHREANRDLRAIPDVDDYFAAVKERQEANSEAGIPIRAANSAETGVQAVGMNSSADAPPSTQPLPGSHVSTFSEPPAIFSSRETPPSIFEGPTRTVKFSDFSLGAIDPASKKNIVQGSSDFNALHAEAQKNKASLLNRLEEIARDVPGAKVYGARVKDLPGLVEKITAKGRAPNTISDYLGARVIVDSPEAMHAFIDRLDRTGAIIEAENFIRSSKFGYRAYHLQVGLGDGMSAELQLVPRPLADVMSASHARRQPVKRLVAGKSPADDARIERALAASTKILDTAWAKAPEAWRTYDEDQHQQPAAFAEEAPQGWTGADTLPDYTRAYTDLGPFRAEPGQPLGRQAQAHVIERGRRTGLEHMVAFDEGGNVLANGHGSHHDIEVPANLIAALDNPKSRIVVHHNHPSDGSLSTVDISQLARPGLAAIWAHGHNGMVSRASLTEYARQRFANDSTDNFRKALYRLSDIVGDSFLAPLRKAVDGGLITPKRGDHLYGYMLGLALHRAGVIDYSTNHAEFASDLDRLALGPYIDKAATATAGVLFNDPRSILTTADRRADTTRHIADLGTSFDRTEALAGRYRPQAGNDLARRASYRPQEGGPGQLRLPGFAESASKFGGGKKPPRPPGATPDDPQHPASRSIRSKIADALGSEFALAAKEKLQDYNARVEKLQKEGERLQNMTEARAHGWVSDNPESPLPDNQQFYTLKRLFPGKRDNVRRAFYSKHFLPLRDLIRKSGMTKEQAGDYLYYKHAPERNLNVGKLYPGKTFSHGQGDPISGTIKPAHPFNEAMRDETVVGASGMSTKAAREGAAAMENGPKGAAFKELGRRAAAIRQFIHEQYLRGHLESAKTLAEWHRTSPNYVPLRGWEDTADAKPFADQFSGRGGGDIRGGESKRALGRRTKADNPLVGLIDQAYRAVDRAEKNLALIGMGRLLQGIGPEGRKEIGVAFERGRPKSVVDPGTGLVKTVDDAFDAMRENAVHFKHNGNDHYAVFDDLKLARAIKRWSPWSVAPIELANRIMGKWKSALTHYNPLFMPRHMARYYIEGLANSFEQMEHGSFKPMKYAIDAFPLIGPATRAIIARERGQPAGELGQHWDEMKAGGGASSLFSMRDYDELLTRLSKEAKAIGRKGYDPREIMSMVTEAVDKFTSMIDNSTRLAAFSQARKAGKTIQQASLVAREATVDYNLKGDWAKVLGTWEPFQNVATQTGYRMGASQGRSRVMRKVFLGMTAIGFLLGMWNYYFAGEDKDKVPFFDKIPEWTKSKELALYVGLTDSKGRPQPISWPAPFNYAFPVTAGYGLASLFFNPHSWPRQLAMVVKSFLSSFSQIGEDGLSWHNLAPALIRPIMDLGLNKSWTGGMIHTQPEWQKGPNAQSGFRFTDPVWKEVAQFINNHSGGTASRSGLLDFYPEDIHYLINSFFGGQMRVGEDIAAVSSAVAKGQPIPLTKVPIGSIFYGTDYDKSDQAAQRERVHQGNHPWERPIFGIAR